MAIRELKNRVKKLKPSKRKVYTLTWDKQEPPAQYDPACDLLVIIDLCGWSKDRYGTG